MRVGGLGLHTSQFLWKMASFSSSATSGLRYQDEGGVLACITQGIVTALFVLLTPGIIHLPWQLIPNPCLGCCMKIQALCWLPLNEWRGWRSIPPQSGHRA